ncbi:hypothetical protein KR018_007225, partial [Drosophila ironensis]
FGAFMVIAVALIVYIAILYVVNFKSKWRRFNNYKEDIHLEDILQANLMPDPGRSIFFIATPINIENIREPKKLYLNEHETCAIESAALHNPNFLIFVLFPGPTNQTLAPGEGALGNYDNVHFRSVDIQNYSTGTPMDIWPTNSYFPKVSEHNILDCVRLITLYRFGGLCLDLDVIDLHRLEKLSPNYVFFKGRRNNFLFAPILNLSPTGIGHQVAVESLNKFKNYLKGTENRPTPEVRTLFKSCNITNMSSMYGNNSKCQNIRVFPPKALYSISLKNSRRIHRIKLVEKRLAIIEKSFVVRLWGPDSRNESLRSSFGSLYNKLAETHCPLTYILANMQP